MRLVGLGGPHNEQDVMIFCCSGCVNYFIPVQFSSCAVGSRYSPVHGVYGMDDVSKDVQKYNRHVAVESIAVDLFSAKFLSSDRPRRK